ncbi:hypothetical protein Q8W15_15190 [Photobacterium damselae subsp. piscicida]|nr:hypothetical protein [Photobacterium damselae subsp. piscicida]MDP2558262.1 hypothetical protein [Photobacterium damselae subsp. piscicida]MDP2567754.1 hypothetical protein [Photobacterium damselae subsp. piscicida]
MKIQIISLNEHINPLAVFFQSIPTEFLSLIRGKFTRYQVVTPIDLLMVKFTFYKRSNNLIVHLFAFRKTNGFSY